MKTVRPCMTRPVRMALRCGLAAALLLAASAAPAAWLEVDGRPSPGARDALQLLADAASDGLAPQDYRAAALAARAAALQVLPDPAADFERDLDAAMLHYLHDLHAGRVDPRALGFRVASAARAMPDFAGLLQQAADQRRLPQLAAQLRPRLAQYGRLRDALARYRALDMQPAPVSLPAAGGAPRPGELWPGSAALRRQLVALGDLDAATPQDGERFDAALAEGLRRFQQRHGLAADGVPGRATLAALAVPFARRVQQIELALERLRWLPDGGAQPFIGINIPMFRLWAWDPEAPASERLDMGVVVGRALNTQTPVLAQEMRYLIFRPYWNVPRSIVQHEMLPAIARDPGYLARNDLELVRGPGDDARALPADAENLALLRQGQLRVRQRPGPKNSLGLVKFIFPNDANVYLHGTPATQLFGRARRDFSHGCVRVEDPLALAQWVLRDRSEWTRERILAAMAGAVPQRVDLARPLPVLLFYMTAMVMPGDGSLHFADDIYGHDARLARALAARR